MTSPVDGVERFTPRLLLAVFGAVAIVVALVPPLSTWSGGTELAQSVQFLLLSVVGPPLIVCGAPWRQLGLSKHAVIAPSADGTVDLEPPVGWFDRRVLTRLTHREPWRGVLVGAVSCGLVVLWRLPVMIGATVHHEVVLLLEALTLSPAMLALWLELVVSPPSRPRLTRPMRIAVSAVVMWTVWVMAYLMGLSRSPWYDGIRHVVGRGLSMTADQQLAAGLIWIVTASAFLPVIFSNLVQWIQSDEDPDDELYWLIRTERRVGGTGTGEESTS